MEEEQRQHHTAPQHQSHIPSSSSSLNMDSEPEHHEELRHMVLTRPVFNQRKRLSKQLSMCEKPRDVAWEKRRRQFLLSRERRRNGINTDQEESTATTSSNESNNNLTDEDLRELKGCIDLGFGFNEEDGQRLTNTLPALDLYFAVNRQFSPSPVSTPNGSSHGSSSSRRSSSVASPRSDSDTWKICSPGDDPEHVKTKLRHWAQAVACSLKQSY